MKLKNVSFLETHFEKLLVAGSVVVLLVAVWMSWFSSPYAVPISGQTLEPGKIDETIASKANALKQAAEVAEPKDPLKKRNDPDLLVAVKEGTSAPIGGKPFTQPLGERPILGKPPIVLENQPYVESQLPDPVIFSAASRVGSINPEEVEENDKLKELFPTEYVKAGAYDVAYASVVGTWDTAGVLEALTKQEDGKRPVPPQKIASAFGIIDVMLQRQTARPDGTWPNDGDPDFDKYTVLLEVTPRPLLTVQDEKGPARVWWDPRSAPDVIKPKELPAGTFTDDKLEDETKVNQYAQMVLDLVLTGENQRDVVQPEFPQTIDGEWVEPLSKEAKEQIGKDEGRAKEIENWFEEKNREIARWKKKAQEARVQRVPTAPTTGGGARPPAGGARPGGAPGGGARSRPAARPEPAPLKTPKPAGAGERTAQQYEERIAKTREQAQPMAAEYLELTKKTISLNDGGGYFGPGIGGPGIPAPGGTPTKGTVRPPQPVPGVPGGFGPGGFGPGGPAMPGGFAMAGGFRGVANGGGNFGGKVNPQAAKFGITSGILSQVEVKIYAHDLKAEPGQTYRYRLAIRYTNPLFGISDMPPEQKTRNANKFLIQSKWTDWTEPQTIKRLKEFFVDSAYPGGAGGGKVNVDVWRFYKGQWHNQVFSGIKPGYPVGQVFKQPVFDRQAGRKKDENIDFFTGAYTLEIAEVKALKPAKGGGGAGKDARVLFVDAGSQTQERLLSHDKTSDDRTRMQDEKRRQEELLAGVKVGVQ